MATPGPSGTRRGWSFDRSNGRLAAVYNDTEVFDFDANDMDVAVNLVASGTLVVDGATTLTGAQTLTGVTTHSAETRIANGFNLRIGTISAFVTTEPTNAIVMKTGTEFAGAITTSGGLMSSDTVVRKVIAAGTVSNVET
jgi:hypothetical protein